MPRLTLAFAALLLSAPALTIFAQDAAEDVAPKQRLQESIDYIGSLPAFSVDIAMDFALRTADGETNETALSGNLSLAGEDKARFRVDVPDGSMELYYAPESKYIYVGAQNQYVDGSAFSTRQHALTAMPGNEYRPAQILFSDLLHDEFSLVEEAEAVTLVANEDSGEAAPDQIRVAGGGIVVDFWIRPGAEPLLEKFTLDMTAMVAQADASVETAVVSYTFNNWNTTPDFEADHFTFTKPEGATELQRAQRPPEPLKGEAAPAVTLDLLGAEGKLDLAAHKGEHVVILDFWASWCGPCRVGLPIVTKVADQFADAGVVLYAVNVGEDPQRAKAFVEQTGLTATVAMDPQRVAARLYGASSIPLTVIIDKEGVVHEIHRGVSSALEQELKATLTELTK